MLWPYGEKRDFLAPSIPFVLPDTTSRIPPRRSNEGQTTHLGELVKNVEFLLPPWMAWHRHESCPKNGVNFFLKELSIFP